MKRAKVESEGGRVAASVVLGTQKVTGLDVFERDKLRRRWYTARLQVSPIG